MFWTEHTQTQRHYPSTKEQTPRPSTMPQKPPRPQPHHPQPHHPQPRDLPPTLSVFLPVSQNVLHLPTYFHTIITNILASRSSSPGLSFFISNLSHSASPSAPQVTSTSPQPPSLPTSDLSAPPKTAYIANPPAVPPPTVHLLLPFSMS